MYKFSDIKPSMRIHCKTEDEAKELMWQLEQLGYKWDGIGLPTSNLSYGFYRDRTYYCMNTDKSISFGSVYWLDGDREVIEFSDFYDDDEEIVSEEPYDLMSLFA